MSATKLTLIEVPWRTGTSFASHRRRVTDLIVDRSFRQDSRLAVLGAGNCNDLDLKILAASFAAVDLFDLDAKVLARGIRFQLMESSPCLFMHGDVDFTGSSPLHIGLAGIRERHLAELVLDLLRCRGMEIQTST